MSATCKLDLLATQRGRRWQTLRSESSARVIWSTAFDKRRARQRPLSCVAPEAGRLFDQSSLCVMTCQQLRLVLGNLGELTFKCFGNASVKHTSRLAQQSAIGCILHKRMFEQIIRVRGHALPEQQACRDETVECRCGVRSLALPTTAANRAWENSRPIAAPICATSLADPSRSSRAISEACRLAGTVRAGDGTAAAVFRASPSLSASSTALVISSTNSGMPSVRSIISCRIVSGSAWLPANEVNHRSDFALPEPVKAECRDVGSSKPRRFKFRAVRDD